MGFYPFLTNFPAKCPMSKTNQENAPVRKSSSKCKTRFLEHRVIAKVDLGKKKNLGTRVLHMVLKFMEIEFQNFFFFFLNFSDCYNSIVQKSSFKLKLDFQKIEFQNNGISLISFISNMGYFAKKFWRKRQMPIFSLKLTKMEKWT